MVWCEKGAKEDENENKLVFIWWNRVKKFKMIS
jgi:hypothetical protein